jgi:NADPH-dependent curcumin reductase CurA
LTREIVLAARPQGTPRATDFELRDAPDAEPGDGQALVRNVLVSVDPYMRSRMSGIRTYVGPYDVGGSIDGGAVGRVVTSRHPGLAEGDWVLTMLGWRDGGVVDGDRVRKLDPSIAPPSTALGVLGMPGLTAWVGLVDVGRVREGETLYVSGAAGAVGSVAAQLAKLRGLRVIGSAGSPEKVAWLESLGISAFDYRTTPLREALADGVDVVFDNVGGEQLEGAINALRPFGRVIACGAISRYNDERAEPGPRNLALVVSRRLRIEGFIVTDHLDRNADFLAEVAPLVRDGALQARETVVEGLERVPEAFAGLFRGDNVGKMLVRVGPDD